MTLIQLQYAIAVSEYLNFTLAAQKSFVTQPTLSMQIQKLEQELNVEIFDRNTHPMTLTPIGKKLIAQAKVIVNEAKKMQHLVYEEQNTMSGTITLGIIPTILPTLLPLFYKNFVKNYPKINLKIKELKTENIVESLKSGTIDFGIAATPLYDEAIVEKVMYFEPLVAYFPPELVPEKKRIQDDELNVAQLILLEEGHCFRENVLNICKSNSLKNRNIDLDSGSFQTIIKLVNDGFGMTLLPLLQANELTEIDKKNIRSFTKPEPTREISLIYHQSQLRISFANAFVKLVQSIIRGMLYLESDNIAAPKLRLK